MRNLPFIGLVAALGAILVAGVSCTDDTKFRALCISDQECISQHDGNQNWACESDLGACVCTGDLACVGENEHCETYPGGDGRCHPNESCEWNQDCEGNTFCDVQDRHCRLTGCTDDLQCDLGELCDPITRSCTPGCRSHGDCTLGDVCLCTGTDGNPVPCPACDGEDRSQCALGQCVANTCADDSFCRYGDFCVEPTPASGELAACESGITEEQPFCSGCGATPGENNRCGSLGPNFCLIDSSDPAGRATYCGVDCSNGQACPNGLSCRDVLILTESTCRGNAQCTPRPNAPECASNEDCPAGARCEAGRCAGSCAVGEGGQSGFCSCVQDDDCPQQSCGSDNRCTLTREPCVPGESDSCRGQIFCVNNGELGYCQIGRNCAPDEGVTCSDVRCDQDPTGCGQ